MVNNKNKNKISVFEKRIKETTIYYARSQMSEITETSCEICIYVEYFFACGKFFNQGRKFDKIQKNRIMYHRK